MWQDLLAAVALLLIIEGLMPFLSPASLRRTLLNVVQMKDQALRIGGFVSMMAGLVLLYIVR